MSITMSAGGEMWHHFTTLAAAASTTAPKSLINTGDALKYFVAFAILLFLARPLKGVLIDAFKVVARLSLVGLGLVITSIPAIQSWSSTVAGWGHVTAVYVPVIAIILLITLSLTQVMFISGKNLEKILKMVIFVVGGAFTAGSPAWVHLWTDVWSSIAGGLGIFVDVVNIFISVVHP